MITIYIRRKSIVSAKLLLFGRGGCDDEDLAVLSS